MKMSNTFFITFLTIILVIGASLIIVKAQGNGIKIDPTCGALTAIVIFEGIERGNNTIGYGGRIIAGICSKDIQGRIRADGNVFQKIENDIRNKTNGMYLSPSGRGEFEIDYRGRFLI